MSITSMKIYVSDWSRINKRKEIGESFPDTMKKILDEYEILKRKKYVKD